MKPGDKVRFLRSSGGGVIRQINKDNTLNVEIDDGFVIPVLKSEIVVIALEETDVFGEKQPSTIQAETPRFKEFSGKGVYLVFSPFNESIYTVELVNASEAEILFTASEQENEYTRGLSREILKPGSFHKIGERRINDFSSWPPLVFQILYFSYENSIFPAPIIKKQSFNPATFFKHKKSHPLTGKDVFVFEIDPGKKALIPDDIKESFGSLVSNIEIRDFILPAEEIDLHIEKLTENLEGMTGDQILKIQIETFENSFEKAVASRIKELTFIHGVGNGILKNHLHKYLSKNENVEFFKDARKEKFGYGATYVKLK